MITRMGWALMCPVVLGCWLSVSAEAATFTVTPATLANNSSTLINFNVGSLTLHHTFRLESFRDLNGNGAVDTGEPLLLSFDVTEGEVPLFGGVRDENRPGDEDGATNGQATVQLGLSQLSELHQAIGPYVVRLSSSDGNFAPISRPFTIVAAAHSQSISGTVRSGATPLGSAVIGLLAFFDDDQEFVAGTVADGSGHFVIPAPAGEYALLALKDGYVFNLSDSSPFELQSGSSVTQDLDMVVATRVISGRLRDAVSSVGVPGVQVFAMSMDGEVTLGTTDSAGDFSLAVTENQWELDLAENGLALLGYGRKAVLANTLTGDETGLDIALTRARGEFELVFFFPDGDFGSGTNGQLSFPTSLEYYYALYNVDGFNLPTNVVFTGPQGSGLSSVNSAIFGANYGGDSAFYSSPQIPVPSYPPGGIYEVSYKGEPMQFQVADPESNNRQVILQPTVSVDGTNVLREISWSYRSVSGSLVSAPAYIAEVEIRVDGIGGRLYDADVSPSENSHVFSSEVIWTNVSSIQMVYEDTLGYQYTCFWRRGLQPLQLLTQTLPHARVGMHSHLLFLGAGGQTPYSWSFQSGNLPPGVNFTPVTGELNGTPTAAGTFTFQVRLTDNNGQQIDRSFDLVVDAAIAPARLEPMAGASPGQFNFRFSGEPGQAYSLQYSLDLTNWITLTVTNAVGGWVDLHDLSATNQARFYRSVMGP